MLADLLQSFFLGFIITAVPGTVFLETVRRIMVNKKSVVIFLAGNVVGVAVTVSIVALGLPALIAQRHISAAFYGISGLMLILIGIVSIRSRPELSKKHRQSKPESRSRLASFVTGFVLATVNPAGIAFWIVMIGRLASAKSAVAVTILDILSINAGAIVCYIAIVRLVGRYKTKLSDRHLIFLSRAFGSLIVAYGIVSLVKGVGLLS